MNILQIALRAFILPLNLYVYNNLLQEWCHNFKITIFKNNNSTQTQNMFINKVQVLILSKQFLDLQTKNSFIEQIDLTSIDTVLNNF